MLGVYCFALCLASVTSSAINIKRPIRNAHQGYEQHPAVRQRSKFVVNGIVTMGPVETTPLSSRCNRKNSNGMCKQDDPRGRSTFLTDLEGTSLGPGFPPKRVGLLVRPNVSREEATSTTAPSKNRFLVDDTPPLPPPPLKRRPLPKGGLRCPLPNNDQRQKDTDQIILGPLSYEDVQNPEMTTQTGENRKDASTNNFNESGERDRALFDSFNDLDYPDPKILSELKGKWYPKYYGENRNAELEGKDEHRRANSKSEEKGENREISKEVNNSGEEKEYYEKSIEEAPVSEEVSAEKTSEDYQISNDGKNQDISAEGHNTHYSTEDDSNEEEEEPALIFGPDNQDNSEENKNPTKGASREEENLLPDTPPTEEQLYDPPLINQRPNGPLENSGHDSVSSREEGSKSEEPTEGVIQNLDSGEAVHSDEGSTEDKDYSEENNSIDSSQSSENSGDETFHLTVEEESNESAQKPSSSSEDTNEIRHSSVESVEGDDEDYNSREQNSQENTSEEQYSQEQQSGEDIEKPSNEYEEDEEEKPNGYFYDVPDYDKASPALEAYDAFPKPEEEPSEKPEDNKKRPPSLYYIAGGSEEQKKEPNKDSDDVENGSKSLDNEDNELKKSEEMDSSISSDEEHQSSGSDDSFGSMGFDSFDFDSEMEPPRVENNVKTTQSTVAVMTSTPPADATKCNNNENSEDQKILKKPSGTVKPNTLQPGDVISFTEARPVNFELVPTPQITTSTFRPASISAIGIIKPGGSIIAKVVSPTLQVHSPTATSPTRADGTQTAPREATAITYLKPPPVAQTQTWFLGQARVPRFIDFFSRPL